MSNSEKFFFKKTDGKKGTASISHNLFDCFTESFDCYLMAYDINDKEIFYDGVKAKMRNAVYLLIKELKENDPIYFGGFNSSKLEQLILWQITMNLREGIDREKFGLNNEGGDNYEFCTECHWNK